MKYSVQPACTYWYCRSVWYDLSLTAVEKKHAWTFSFFGLSERSIKFANFLPTDSPFPPLKGSCEEEITHTEHEDKKENILGTMAPTVTHKWLKPFQTRVKYRLWED